MPLPKITDPNHFSPNHRPKTIAMRHCYGIVSNDEYWQTQMTTPFSVGTNNYRAGDYLIWNATKGVLFGIPKLVFGEHFGILNEETD